MSISPVWMINLIHRWINAVGTAQYPADRLLTINGVAQTIDQDFRLPL